MYRINDGTTMYNKTRHVVPPLTSCPWPSSRQASPFHLPVIEFRVNEYHISFHCSHTIRTDLSLRPSLALGIGSLRTPRLATAHDPRRLEKAIQSSLLFRTEHLF